MIVSGNTITGSSGFQSGGGAYIGGAATVANTSFSNNVANSNGGGLFAASTLALSGTQFISNTASSAYGGGAVAVGATTLNGGGLTAFSPLTLTGTQFLGNTSGSQGGGLYLNGATAKQVVNTLFARNGASSNGAAIYVDGAAPLSLIHTTLVSPTSPAGATQAVYVAAGTVYLSNTLIATHTIGIARAVGTVRAWNTLFAGVNIPYSGTVTSAGGTTGTAGFVNPAADDYHLGAGSAAINAGIDAGVYTDFEGDVRPQAGGYDIGYDESPFAPLAPRAYLPVVVW